MKKLFNIKIKIMIPALILAGTLVLSSCEESSNKGTSYDYLTIDEVNDYLENIASAYSLIAAIENVGTSNDGRTIKGLVISGSPSLLEMEPRIRLSAAIHGNEKITTEVLIRFIDYLVSEYGRGTPEIVNLVNSRYIVIIPVINPDGYAIWSRYNTNGIDLNRNFSREWTPAGDHGTAPFSESESQGIRDYSSSTYFTSAITYHAGDVIVNMPFDYTTTKPAENILVKYMGLKYTESGIFLENTDILDITGVYNGTINGADWYVINGSMQDWSYLDTGCLDYTVEISVDKSPSTEYEIEQVYNYNRDSLVAFIRESGIGVYGRITDGTNALSGVKITTPDGDIVVYSDSRGYYHRLLTTGTYNLTFELTGYIPQTVSVDVTGGYSGEQQDITLVHE